MAKRRSKEEINFDKVIKKNLLNLGEKIYQEAKKNSRVAKDTYYKDGTLNKAGGTLRDSQNYFVKPDTKLTMVQVYYGKFQKPNELLMSVERHTQETTDLIIKEINDILLKDFK